MDKFAGRSPRESGRSDTITKLDGLTATFKQEDSGKAALLKLRRAVPGMNCKELSTISCAICLIGRSRSRKASCSTTANS